MSVRRTIAAAAFSLTCAMTAFAQPQEPAPADAAAAAAAPTSASTPDAGSARFTEGRLAYYGAKFAGRKTANGERFDPNALTMAHRTLPFGTLVKVTNLANRRSVVVRVNDRGPAVRSRLADVSHAAAQRLRMLGAGVVKARFEVIGNDSDGSARPRPGA
jgi:rare lipoprotein A